MSNRFDRSGWLSERTGLSVLALTSAVLATLILLPYLQYILLGIVLAYVLMPIHRRLERFVGPMISALTLVVVTVLTILIPLAYILAIAFRQALELITAIQEGTFDVSDVEAHLEEKGYPIDIAELYETYQEPIETTLQGLATSGIELVSGLPGVLIGLTVTLFVLFALLRDGDRLVAWTRRVLPIDDEIQRELLTELDHLMWASVVGNAAVAAIQAVALGVGLMVLDVPAVVFLTVLTFVLALLPLVGAFGVWVPLVGYLILVGDPVGGVTLSVYGSLVSVSDTYLRPALIGRTSAFNSAIVVVGIFGGIVVFGGIGLFIGPVVLGGAKVTLDVFARERLTDEGEDAEETTPAADPAVDTDPETGIRTEGGAPSGGEGGSTEPSGSGADGDGHEEELAETEVEGSSEPELNVDPGAGDTTTDGA